MKLLWKKSDQVEPAPTELSVDLGPDDVLILMTEKKITSEQAEEMQAAWKAAVRDGALMFLSAGLRPVVIKNARKRIVEEQDAPEPV